MYKEYPKLSYDECLKYVRKSRTDDPTMTLDEVLQKQNMQLDEFSMRELGGIVPEEQTYREIKSSETIEDRPEMNKLLKAIENPKVKGVLVREVERLSRGDMMDAGFIIRAFKYSNTLIVTPSRTYDLNDEADRMIVEMFLKSGNQYLEYAKKVMKQGKDLAAMNGEYIAKEPPYGYKKISYKEGRRNVKTLEIEPEEAQVVRLVFNSYAEDNMSMYEIADMLNKMAIKPRFRETWIRNAIAEMLMNPVYMGKIRWNYRQTVKGWENKDITKSRPRRSIEESMFEGKHEAIITEELFWKAHERKKQNVPLKKSNELKNPLAGIFFCAKCGKAMRFRSANGKNKASFECTEVKLCGNGAVLYEDVMNELISALKGYIEDFEVSVSNDNSDEVARHQIMVESMKKRLIDVERKEIALWDKYAEENMPKNIFDKLMEKTKAEKTELQKALQNAYESMPSQEDYQEKIMSFTSTLDSLLADSISAKDKNTLLRSIIGKMTFEREKSILLTKEMAAQMNIPYTHRLCRQQFPFKLDIYPKD